MIKSGKKIIGIIGTLDIDVDDFHMTLVYDGYRDFVYSKGCIPFLILPLQDYLKDGLKADEFPPLTDEEIATYKEMVDMCDGVVIPGGDKIFPFHDVIIQYAIEKDIPVLGICLGMQILANIDNQEYCLLKDETGNHKKVKEKYVHSVIVEDNTMLKRLVGDNKIQVNSNHQYYVSKTNRFIVSATAEDGIIEAIELPGKKFVMGVQWHPERMFLYDSAADEILDAFINACS